MFHGPLDQHTAKGLKELRRRIGLAKIPASKLDETLNIATWNIREFGRERSGHTRSQQAIHYIAEIIHQFDIVALTELRDDLRDLKRVMAILGDYWKLVFSDFDQDDAGNNERIAYLYDERMIRFTGLAAEADPPAEKVVVGHKSNGDPIYDYRETKVSWWRSPYMASFQAGNFDFILVAAHMRWGKTVKARTKAIEGLAQWAQRRRTMASVVDKDFILLGDFNIPSRRSGAYKALTKAGFELPRGLMGDAKKFTTNRSRKNVYDQILHSPGIGERFTKHGGALDFFLKDWSGLFIGPEFSGRNFDPGSDDFTYELSDHLPLWVQVDTWIDDAILEQILAGHAPGSGNP